MCEYCTPEDIEYYYDRVSKLINSLSRVAPETADGLKQAIKEKKESPFAILFSLCQTLIYSKRTRSRLR